MRPGEESMELKFSVSAHISKPLPLVFEAVADPDQLSHYFTTGGAKGRLEGGRTVTWDFHDFPGAFPVTVVEAVPNEKIVLRWQANDEDEGSYETVVTIDFEPVGEDRTRIAINEHGWRETQSGLKASYGNCQGWSQMLCALKAWLEHGINLREGMYK
jgi:uncharacterized protein YndB with AHSA1/START domain